MAFDPSMITGDPAVDQQHREFYTYLSQLEEAVATSASQQVLTEILAKLEDFVVFHFKCEEALMQAEQYPYLNAHRKMHQELAHKAGEIITGYRLGKHTMPVTLISLMAEWVADHVADFDKPMVAWVRARKHTGSGEEKRYVLKPMSQPPEF